MVREEGSIVVEPIGRMDCQVFFTERRSKWKPYCDPSGKRTNICGMEEEEVDECKWESHREVR